MAHRARFLRLDIGMLLALSVVLLSSGWHLHLVSAHAALDRSNPATDSVVTEAPDEIELFFTQEIDQSGTEIRVLDHDGNRVDKHDTTLDLNDPDRKRVTVTLQTNLASGVYTVDWVTLSAEDGEEDSGSFAFTLQLANASPVASPVASPSASPAASPTQAAG